MLQSIITSPYKQHCNNSTRRVQKWNNLEFEINSIYRHWEMSHGRWMPVFIFFLEHSYYSDFNYSLWNFLVPENKSKICPLTSYLTLPTDLDLSGCRLFYIQESDKSLWELRFPQVLLFNPHPFFWFLSRFSQCVSSLYFTSQ